MNGLPKICATKADFELIREENITGWQARWRELLEGRFVIVGDDLVEDGNATIFRLGFSPSEVASAIGHTGLTNREIEWRASQPDRYHLVDGNFWEIEGWAEARLAAKVSEAVAVKGLEIEAESQRRQQLDFEMDGHTWYADDWATKTIQNCALSALINKLDDAGPVQVPFPLQNGYWYTAQLTETGDRIAAPMTVAAMKRLATALYNRNGLVWGKEMIHKATIEAMAASGSLPAEIEAYDVSVGW